MGKALLTDPVQMKADAEALKAEAKGKTVEELFETVEFKRLAGLGGKFKYTYVFGVGLIQLMQLVDPVVEPVAGASAQTKKLTLMKDMFAQMKASNEKKAAKAAEDEAAGIVSTDPRSIKNTK